jgi:hypothetical protein
MRSTNECSTGALDGRQRTIQRWALLRFAVVLALLLAPAVGMEVDAQIPRMPPVTPRVKLGGPRFGVTYLGGRIVDSLSARSIDVSPVITQFGWQWERQFYPSETGPSVVIESVALIGGLEQGAFLPSLSWIVGMRTRDGAEFGIGPNLGPSGYALVFAGGVTRRAAGMNFPLNVSVVPSKIGTRVSLLAGFTMR